MDSIYSYTQAEQTSLFTRLGVFFAFSQEQLKRGKQEGVNYSILPGGMVVPAGNESVLISSLAEIQAEGVRRDIEENGITEIIKRELYNFECFYSCDISDCVEALADYGISEKQIRDIFETAMSKET